LRVAQLQVFGDERPAHGRRAFPLEVDLAQTCELILRQIEDEPLGHRFINGPAPGRDGGAGLILPLQGFLEQARERAPGTDHLFGIEVQLELDVRPGQEQDGRDADAEPLVEDRDRVVGRGSSCAEEDPGQGPTGRRHDPSWTHDRAPPPCPTESHPGMRDPGVSCFPVFPRPFRPSQTSPAGILYDGPQPEGRSTATRSLETRPRAEARSTGHDRAPARRGVSSWAGDRGPAPRTAPNPTCRGCHGARAGSSSWASPYSWLSTAGLPASPRRRRCPRWTWWMVGFPTPPWRRQIHSHWRCGPTVDPRRGSSRGRTGPPASSCRRRSAAWSGSGSRPP